MRSRSFHTTQIALVVGCCGLAGLAQGQMAAPLAAAKGQPQNLATKPAHWPIGQGYSQRVIAVKFFDDSTVRAVQGRLTNLAPGQAARNAAASYLSIGTWVPMFSQPEPVLQQMRATATANLQQQFAGRAQAGPRVVDLRTHFMVEVPAGVSAQAMIDALNTLPEVEMAQPHPEPVAPPVVGEYQDQQKYWRAANQGLGFDDVKWWKGGTGKFVKIADAEYTFNSAHVDLPTITNVVANGIEIPGGNDDHGTAVLGQLVSKADGAGTTGAAWQAGIAFAATYTFTPPLANAVWDVGDAVTKAAANVGNGGVVLIEQQLGGPNVPANPPPGSQLGLVPVEWYKPWYDAIVTVVGNGVTVVEAAGNGSENLDGAAYGAGNGGHFPFKPANASGAIIVGAGAVQGGSDKPRSRLGFSNYGSILSLQGHGENVVTTGYGTLLNTDGKNKRYASDFGGTSGASPCVTAAVALAQSIRKGVDNTYFTPAQIRTLLINNAIAQQAGTNPVNQKIGPMPNLKRALFKHFGDKDCNNNLVPDYIDIKTGHSKDANNDGIPDECAPARCGVAPDGPEVDMGSFTPQVTVNVSNNQPAAIHFHLDRDVRWDGNTFLDIAFGGGDLFSPTFALYNAKGTLIATSCGGSDSTGDVMTFGKGTRPASPAIEQGGIPRDGRHGSLTAGDYVILVGRCADVFGPCFDYTPDDSTFFEGTATIDFTHNINPVCYGDFNNDGFIDFTDFDAFVIQFELGNSIADFDGDGFLDFNDFDLFVAAFEFGC